jgi:hypothetical protein
MSKTKTTNQVNAKIASRATKTNVKGVLSKLSSKEQDWVKYGKNNFEFLQDQIREALLNNPFNDHYLIYSEPGFSKTFTTNQTCRQNGIVPLQMNGNLGLFAFAADLAYALDNIEGDEKIKVVFDDCDSLFEKNNINVLKGIFDKERNVLGWNKALTGAVLSSLDEEQVDAIMQYRLEGRSGFEIPTDRFTFITLTNKPLASSIDIENATDSKKQLKKDENAIRRRVEYRDMTMEKETAWGYCVHVLLTEKLIEKYIPNASDELKLEMINWTSPLNKWNRITDRNLSLFEKMAKDYVKYPKNYLDKWETSYTKL